MPAPVSLRLPRFSASVVVRRTCRVWFTSLHHLLVISVAFLAPAFALAWLVRGRVSKDEFGRVLGSGTFLFMFLMQGAVVSLVFQKLRGQRPQVLASIGAGFKRALSVIGVVLVMAIASSALIVGGSVLEAVLSPSGEEHVVLGVTYGFVLLAMTFLLVGLFLAWCVAIPAAVVEKLPPTRALARSMRLTKGSRLRIFGALLLLSGVFFVGELVIVSPLMMLARFYGLTAAPWLLVVVLTLVASFVSVWPAVLYHELRETKEGIGLEQLASVFQ